MTTLGFRSTLFCGLALSLAGFGWQRSAAAHDHVDLSIGIGAPTYVAPAYVAPAPVERRWVPGHYETRLTTVLVEPERHERQFVPPISHVRFDSCGCRYTVTSPGYYRDIVIPPHYETRETRIWVEGYYQDVAVAPPPVVYHRPAFSIGGFFHF
jgi:hypothetical protein